MVIKKDSIADISITSEESSVGHFTPVIGVEYGVSVDYDVKTQEIYWVETKNADESNGTLYKTSHVLYNTIIHKPFSYKPRI